METQRKHIYIGLGGAGIRSIMKAKKLVIDEYGKVPTHIRFLGIDMGRGELGIKMEGYESLSGDECCAIDGWTWDYYQEHKQALSWMSSQNERQITYPSHPAANGLRYRTNGRLAFFKSFEKIKKAISSAFERLGASNRSFDEPPIGVHVVFSLAGGTGAGLFLDVAYLIRKICGTDIMLKGYAILPGVFMEMNADEADYYSHNAHGALCDLDFLMHLREFDEPVTFDWILDTFTEKNFRCTPTPYDWVYLIDNKSNGGRVLSYRDLTDTIGLALFLHGGSMGLQEDALLNCLRPAARYKALWALSLGASQVVFDNGLEEIDMLSQFRGQAIERQIWASRPLINVENCFDTDCVWMVGADNDICFSRIKEVFGQYSPVFRVNTGIKDKILFYSRLWGFPVSSVSGVRDWRGMYGASSFFDEHIR